MVFWIKKTAWAMTPPVPYSTFHILFVLIGLILAIFFAYEISRLGNAAYVYRILFVCGLLLLAAELYKQIFLYYVVNDQSYDWWYFPFQLCSLPMYLCLCLPLFRHAGLKRVLCTFIRNFGLLGGIMALAEPSGLMHPYWTLTIHGLSWHILLIFISLLISFSGIGSHDFVGYLHTLLLFLFSCGIATTINVFTHGVADMFYISPYYPVTQVIFNQISIHYGIAMGIVIYLFAVCMGGYLCHKFTIFLENLTQNRRNPI